MSSGKLCYLDFGMVSYVESSQRYSIIEAVVHLVNRDFNSLAELYKRMGFIPSDVDTKPIVIALEDALPNVLSAPVGELNFKNVSTSTFLCIITYANISFHTNGFLKVLIVLFW